MTRQKSQPVAASYLHDVLVITDYQWYAKMPIITKQWGSSKSPMAIHSVSCYDLNKGYSVSQNADKVKASLIERPHEQPERV